MQEHASQQEFDPWTMDASHPASRGREYLRQLTIYEDPIVAGFCEKRNSSRDWERETSKVVVARRGVGKSHVLAARSLNHREDVRGSKRFLFHPSGNEISNLVDLLFPQEAHLARSHRLRAKDCVFEWSQVWQIAIIAMWVWKLSDDKQSCRTLPEYISVFPNVDEIYSESNNSDDDADSTDGSGVQKRSPIGWFVSSILLHIPEEIEQCSQRLRVLLSRALQEWSARIISQINRMERRFLATYIDAPDEMFAHDDYHVWRNAQAGLYVAVFQLERHTELCNHLRVYASVRAEAIDTQTHPLVARARGVSVRLEYGYEILKSLFVRRVQKSIEREGDSPIEEADEAIGSFCGTKFWMHSDRVDPSGMKIVEPIFDAILRHTRMVPRELVAIGGRVAASRSSNERMAGSRAAKISVHNVVNMAAIGNINWTREEGVTPLSKISEGVLSNFAYEVISVDQLVAVIGDSQKNLDGFHALISAGLLGYSEPAPEFYRECYSQRFAHGEETIDSDGRVLEKKWYFLHPAFKEWLKSKGVPVVSWNLGSKSEKSYLIGNGLRFEGEEPKVRLLFISGSPHIRFSKGSVNSEISCRTLAYMFLFIALYAWKSAKGVPLTIGDLISAKTKLIGNRKDSEIGSVSLPRMEDAAKTKIQNYKRTLFRRGERLQVALECCDLEAANGPYMTFKNGLVEFPELDVIDVMVDDLELGSQAAGRF